MLGTDCTVIEGEKGQIGGYSSNYCGKNESCSPTEYHEMLKAQKIKVIILISSFSGYFRAVLISAVHPLCVLRVSWGLQVCQDQLDSQALAFRVKR